MLVVENLTKNIDNIPVLDGASLTIEDGSIYGLVGKNGAGKTTIIRHLAGVLRQDSGSIRYDDEDIWENAELRQRIGLIPDEIYFPPGYSLRNMRKMYSRIYHNWNPERYQELLERFGLPEKKNLRTFSKGQKKQAAFCLVMSIMPDYLLLDEPLDGLDPIMRKTIWELIIDDVAEREMSVLISSHNLKELENICDRIGIINKGTTTIELGLDEIQDDYHKLQLAFRPDTPEVDILSGLKILHREKYGSTQQIIAEGSIPEITETINRGEPVIFDIMPLSLEEFFIYILGGEGNEYEVEQLVF